MRFLYWLESIRTPFITDLMLAITHLGEEVPFLVAALIVFWCVDKYHGYYMLAVGLLGNMANQFLKITCRIPRPWTRGDGFAAVEAAKAEAGGYSFPSGHSQTSVGTFGCIAVTQKNKFIRWTCLVVMIMVPFSRMYLGVHTPADVLVGSAMALVLVAALKPLTKEAGTRFIPTIFMVLLVLSVLY